MHSYQLRQWIDVFQECQVYHFIACDIYRNLENQVHVQEKQKIFQETKIRTDRGELMHKDSSIGEKFMKRKTTEQYFYGNREKEEERIYAGYKTRVDVGSE